MIRDQRVYNIPKENVVNDVLAWERTGPSWAPPAPGVCRNRAGAILGAILANDLAQAVLAGLGAAGPP